MLQCTPVNDGAIGRLFDLEFLYADLSVGYGYILKYYLFVVRL